MVDLQSELIQSSGHTLDGAALAATPTKTYSGQWDQYQEFCVDHAREPILTGANQKRDLETLLLYVAFEYVMHGNSYETVRGKMYAIRWFVMEHDYPDPLRDRPKLWKRLKGLKKLRGGRCPKKVATPSMFWYIKTVLTSLAVAHDLWAHATMTAAYFLLARTSEICAQGARNHATYSVCRKHSTFYKAGVECE